MKLISIIFLSITLITISGCSSLSVNYDYNQTADFTHYKKYDWQPFPKEMEVSQLNRSRFVTAVNINLASKGFKQNASDADFLIATHFGTEERVDLSDWGYSYAPTGLYRGYGYRHPSYSPALVNTGGINVYQYEEGTLILDFIDAKTKQLIWRATAKGTVSPASTPAEQTEKINSAVQEILANFPPSVANTKT